MSHEEGDYGPHWYDLDHNRIRIDQANELLASRERIIAQEQVGAAWVSTVFLVLDHNFTHQGPPLLYETMVFIDGVGDYQWRTATRHAALAWHDQTCAAARDCDDPTQIPVILTRKFTKKAADD